MTAERAQDDPQSERLRRRLSAWYEKHKRPLAWRQEEGAWAVWLSEVLLQQTRAEHAEPYFRRMLEAFPTLQALAESPLEEVLAHWSGLGYYRRARLLHRAAREVMAQGGAIPTSVEGLKRLPGVGEYTAAAVASIAFGAVEPALDGNVERVMVRLLALEGDPRRAAARRILRDSARKLLDSRRPGESNQALMELGAQVCIPRRPRCPRCPLSDGCLARKQGAEGRIPPPRARRKGERRALAVAVVESERGGVLLFRRPEGDGLLEGTWELPWAKGGSPSEVERALGERYGGSWCLKEGLGMVRHSVTFRRLEVTAHRAEAHGADHPLRGDQVGWFDRAAQEQLARSSLVAKVLALDSGRA